MRAPPLLAALLVAAAPLLATGCGAPCERSDDCPAAEYCSAEGLCQQDCTQNGDCGTNRLCQRGECTLSSLPLLEWVSPPENADVGEEFDVTVQVSYRAESVRLELSRVETDPGERCAPLVPYVQVLEGSASEDLTRLVTFPGVRSLGESFGLELYADANGAPVNLTRTFRGTAPEGLGGAFILEPREGDADADDALTMNVAAQIDPPADIVTVWTEPLFQPTTPRVVAATGNAVTEIDDVTMPLSRGPQVVWIETDRDGERLRCGVGVTTTNHDNPRPLELGLVWDSLDGAGRVDLQVVAERDNADVELCRTADSAVDGVCLAGDRDDFGLRRHGEQIVLLDPVPGIYGLAVIPSSAASAVRARVRVSNGDVHLGWLGPRTVQADQGMVWLAGRLVVLEGVVRLEPVDRTEPGLPELPGSAW